MARILTTAREVVDAVGGVSAVAREFQIVETAVWNWIGSGRFPNRTYVGLHEMLSEAHASAPNSLWSMAPRISRQQREIAA